MRVLFWGTPDFATPALRALLGEGFDVVAVVTQPDRAAGRSRSRLVAPAVKRVAIEESLPVLQPDRPRGDDFLATARAFEPDVSLVVAYGHLLPAEAIDLARLGTMNIHASLLPALRGAAPIQAAILQGLDETGVSIVRMVQRLDAGPVVLQQRTPILHDETAGELTLRLSELGALAAIEALTLLDLGQSTEREQDESLATYAPKIDREMARVSWSSGADEVARGVRAFDPRPGSFTRLDGRDVKLFGARAVRGIEGDAGRVLEIGEEGMLVACGVDATRIAYVHPAGGRRLAALDWAQGRGVHVGDQFAS